MSFNWGSKISPNVAVGVVKARCVAIPMLTRANCCTESCKQNLYGSVFGVNALYR